MSTLPTPSRATDGAGKWTSELVHTLRADDADTQRDALGDSDSQLAQPLTVVLDQVADIDDAGVEFDPVPLDFLGPPRILSCLVGWAAMRLNA